MRPIASAIVAALLAPLGVSHALAQMPAYPAKPVRVVVPTSPASGTDNVARLSAQKLSESLKRPFVVENRPGGGGQIPYGFVAKAAPDGYTLLVVPPSFAFTQALYPEFPYDPLKDYTPISLLTVTPFLVLVHPSLPAKSMKELVALARANPNALNAGVGFSGSFTHLALAALVHAANVKVTMVPYKGMGDVLINTVAGHLQLCLADIVTSLPQVRAGRLRPLAVTSTGRSSVYPDLPTVSQAGLKGFQAAQWIGWVGPAGLPPAIVHVLSEELARAFKSPDVVKHLTASGGESVGSTPEEFQRLIAEESARWRRVIKDMGMKVD